MAEHTRKLAAIMFTDMVGFTAIMQKDEEIGLKLRARHKAVIEQAHQDFAGEIIQYFGDGTLSIFDSSIAAVNCAIFIQRALKKAPEVPLRIGIHSGTILVESDGIIGDAVNIASRIESFANSGGVLISDFVLEEVKNQSQLAFVSLGKFKLKNIDRLFDIYAIDVSGIQVPSLEQLQGKGERAVIASDTLPTPSSPILGREVELIDLAELLASNQVVSITGTGGMGKTRVAVELARRLGSSHPGGLVYISWSTKPGADGLFPALGAALEVKEASGRDLLKGITSILLDKKVLLVFDNLEHIKHAAREVSDLVTACPNVRILCTSRSPLKIKMEQEYPLHALPMPNSVDLDSLLDYPAVDLFVSRAKKANLRFELTKENAADVLAICLRMDGLPLALELAAARIRMLPPDRLLKRLGMALDLLKSGQNDVPDRHQTLRKTIDWSYNLLEEPEKILFRKISIFTGGFTLEGLEEVCYADEDAAFLALDELESLCDKGLVEKIEGGTRFIQLQTIQDFAKEKLNEFGGIDEAQQKHAAYYVDFAVILSRGTYGERQLERMKLGLMEDSNILAALDYLLKLANSGNEDARESGLQMCGDLWMYWHIKGWNISTRDYCNAFMQASPDQAPTLGKSKALMGLAVAYWMLGAYDDCLTSGLLHHANAKEIGHELEIGKSKVNLVCGYLFQDLEKSRSYAEEAVEIFERLKEPYWLGLTRWFQGNIHMMAGDLGTAKEKYNESLALTKIHNDYEHKGGSLGGLALIDHLEGNLKRSIQLYEDALEAYSIVGDVAEVARILSEMSWVYLADKDTHSARKYTLKSIEAYQKVGSPRGVGLSLIGLACIESVEGRPIKAIEITSAAEKFANQEGIVNVYGDNDPGKNYLDAARGSLSELEVKRAMEAGSLMSLENVIQLFQVDVVGVM